ncbi:MAG: SpoIIE family protein phosphatase [Solirubrobacteraceae bacterium]
MENVRHPPFEGDALDDLLLDRARFRSLALGTQTMVWISDREGNLLSDLPAWREVTGQSPDDLLGHGWLAGLHPDDRERVEATWDAAVTTGSRYETTYRIADADGRSRWLDVRGVPVLEGDDGIREWIGTCVDVTDRHEAETALAEDRAVLRSLVEQTPTAVAVLWGPEHRFRMFNRAYEEVVPAGRLTVGATVAELFPEAVEAAVPLLDRAFGGETVPLDPLVVPFSGPEAHRGHRYYRGSYAPLRSQGEPLGVLVIAHEVTHEVRERESLERQLEEERGHAERVQQALLPDSLPAIDGLDLAVHYQPASVGSGVGGDWYDAFTVSPTHAVLVIGDVCGRGVAAATVMAQFRATVRAFAYEDPRPARIAERASDFARRLGTDVITMGVGLIDTTTGELSYASAGHLPPLVCTPDEGATFLDVVGDPLLGIDAPDRRETRHRLTPGATLVLFTDGLVEERRRSLDVTLEELRGVVSCEASAHATCRRIVDSKLHETETVDDVALLIVRFAGEAGASTSR